LTFSNYGLLLLVGEYPIRKLVPYEKDFGWMALNYQRIRRVPQLVLAVIHRWLASLNMLIEF
jgi:hypothetical protein